MKVTLYVNYYAESSPARREELDECLKRNLDNPYIDRVIVLAQTAPKLPHEKLTCIPFAQRPTFRHYFKTVNSIAGAADVNIIANSDIYFDDSIGRLFALNLSDRCLALTRWDVQPDGKSKPLGWNNSQDAWIFQGCIRDIEHSDFCLGQPACDWRLAAELRRCGYDLFNPSMDIRAHHLHLCGVRHYSNKDFVHGDHAEVEVTNMAAIPDRQTAPGVISFSLFGDNPRYTVGAIENVILAKSIYPGWACRFYIDETVPRDCLDRLRVLGAQVIRMPRQTHALQGTFWRFLAADDPGFDCWIIRDTDSRLSYRERRAVDEWIKSGAPFHIMHDHPWQNSPIMGGAFGGIRQTIPDMAGKIKAWERLGFYGADQQFLTEAVYPLVKDIALQHHSFADNYGGLLRPFPTPFEDLYFVGERINADGTCHLQDREALLAALHNTQR